MYLKSDLNIEYLYFLYWYGLLYVLPVLNKHIRFTNNS